MQDGDVSYLSPEYRGVLERADAIRKEYKASSTRGPGCPPWCRLSPRVAAPRMCTPPGLCLRLWLSIDTGRPGS
jgi:hypothetical protein